MFRYYFFAIITAPGVVVHEIGHALFCLLAGVKIHHIKFFQFKQTAGYVIHDEPKNIFASITISFGPLIINSFLTLLCFAHLNAPYFTWLNLLFAWLALAVGLHAIPSTGDAQTLLSITNHRFWRNPFVIVAYPFALILYLLNLLKRLHADVVYVLLLFWLARFYFKA